MGFRAYARLTWIVGASSFPPSRLSNYEVLLESTNFTNSPLSVAHKSSDYFGLRGIFICDKNTVMTIYSVTLNVSDASHLGGNVTIGLYIYDKRLMDVAAELASSVHVQVPPTDSIQTILQVDTSKLRHSEDYNDLGRSMTRSWDEMMEPSMYVALLMDQSELGYSTGGPVFNLSPGDSANLVLASKN